MNRKLAKNALIYRRDVLFDKRKGTPARLIKVSGNVRNLIDSGQHVRRISEEFSQSKRV